MKRFSGRRAWFAWASLVLLALPAAGGAATPADAPAEIGFLLGYIESSGCEFYRNGSTYDAVHAAAHLRDKYVALGVTGKAVTAEIFIDRIASRSSLSGRNYEVRCAGQERMWTAPWLRDALARFRVNGASRG